MNNLLNRVHRASWIWGCEERYQTASVAQGEEKRGCDEDYDENFHSILSQLERLLMRVAHKSAIEVENELSAGKFGKLKSGAI